MRKSVHCLLALCCSVAEPAAQELWFPESGVRELVLPKGVERVAVPMYGAGRGCFIEVEIGDSGPLLFLADTGWVASCISESVANKLRLPKIGPASHAAGQPPDRPRYRRVTGLRVGDLEVSVRHMPGHDFTGMNRESGMRFNGKAAVIAGAIGVDILSRIPLSFDFAAGQLVFHRPESFVPPDSGVQTVITRGGLPGIRCRVNGQEDLSLMIDTGAGAPLSLKHEWWQAHPGLHPTPILGRGLVFDSAGDSRRSTLRDLVLELPGDGPSPVLAWVDEGSRTPPISFDGLLGISLLRGRILTLDLASGRAWLSPRIAGSRNWKPDPQAVDLSGRSALHHAIEHRDVAALKILLDQGADPDHADHLGITPLHDAAMANRLEMLRLLLDAGANPEGGDHPAIGRPLHMAAKQGHQAIAEALLLAGADIDSLSARRMSALTIATLHGHGELARWLVGQGATPDSDRESLTPVLAAAGIGDFETLELLRGRGARLDRLGPSGENALHLAAAGGNDRMVAYLLDEGFDLGGRTLRTRQTPLFAALIGGNSQTARELLERGAEVGFHDQSGETLLMMAAKSAEPEVVELLIEHGADVNAQSRSGHTALFRAIENQRPQAVIEALLDAGAEVDVTAQHRALIAEAAKLCDAASVAALLAKVDGDRRPHILQIALAGAANHGRIETARLLIGLGADVNAAVESAGTPLGFAALGNRREMLEMLLDAGADPSPPGRECFPPIGMAATGGHLALVERLIEFGADVNAANAQGGTALICAARYGSLRCVEALVAAGADLEQADDQRYTPLMSAVFFRQLHVAEWLLEHGANFEAEDLNGDRCLHIAVRVRDIELTRCLLAAGCDVDIRNRGGLTALHQAVLSGQADMVEFLLEVGADPTAQTPTGRQADEMLGTNAARIRRLLDKSGPRSPSQDDGR